MRINNPNPEFELRILSRSKKLVGFRIAIPKINHPTAEQQELFMKINTYIEYLNVFQFSFHRYTGWVDQIVAYFDT